MFRMTFRIPFIRADTRIHVSCPPCQSHVHQKCTLLQGQYTPPVWMPNGHAQSVLSLIRYPVEIQFKKETVEMMDGGGIDLMWDSDFLENRFEEKQIEKILLIAPGLTASYKSVYVRSLVEYCRRNGVLGVVYTYRGFFQELKSPICSSCYDVSDMEAIIAYIKRKYPKAKLNSVGFSMGANMLAKVAGKSNPQLNSLVLISNGWDFERLSLKLEKEALFYSRLLTRQLKENIFSIEANRQMMKLAGIDIAEALSSQTIRELDDKLTRHLHGVSNVSDYYHESSV